MSGCNWHTELPPWPEINRFLNDNQWEIPGSVADIADDHDITFAEAFMVEVLDVDKGLLG